MASQKITLDDLKKLHQDHYSSIQNLEVKMALLGHDHPDLDDPNKGSLSTSFQSLKNAVGDFKKLYQQVDIVIQQPEDHLVQKSYELTQKSLRVQTKIEKLLDDLESMLNKP